MGITNLEGNPLLNLPEAVQRTGILQLPLANPVAPKPACRLGDRSQTPSDAHGCPACPHPGIGPAITGSPNVNINGRPAVRETDQGIHAACCGPNMWRAQHGSQTVRINGLGAMRMGDPAQHCGGNGNLIEGSPNVLIGEVHWSEVHPSQRRPSLHRR